MNKATSDGTANIDIKDLASTVAGLSRFLTLLSKIEPFQEAGLGLAEWLALSILADKNGINSRQLANLLGVSAQRVNQIAESLKASELITLKLSADDARQKAISVTPVGEARLNKLNTRLQTLIDTHLSKRPEVLSRTNRAINRILMKIVLPPKAARPTRPKATDNL